MPNTIDVEPVNGYTYLNYKNGYHHFYKDIKNKRVTIKMTEGDLMSDKRLHFVTINNISR